jgi:general secretion pathway protein E
MGVADYLLGSSLAGVLAQRLVRRLCEKCAAAAEPSPALIETLRRHGLIEAARRALPGLKRKVGCEACRGTGYVGRTTIAELLVMDDAVREGMLSEPTDRALEAIGVRAGMTTLFQNGLAKAMAGDTTMDEVLRVSRVV